MSPIAFGSDPYANARWELEVWREDTRLPHAWRGRLTLHPVDGFGIPLTYGNEYTGLIYGWTHDSIVRRATRAAHRCDRRQKRCDVEVINL